MTSIKLNKPEIAIIGGGASGISVFLHLAENATTPFKIFLIEKNAVFGSGTAFGTPLTCHPLNVKACRMGIYADRPEDFYHWLIHREEFWRPLDPDFFHIKIYPEAYLPRKLYSFYLQDSLNQAALLAQEKGVLLEKIHAEIIDIKEQSAGFDLITGEGLLLSAKKVVLSMGILPTKSPSFETPKLLSKKNYTSNIWETPLDKKSFEVTKTILIMGSGLTAIDAIFSLQSLSFKGKIKVISPSGKFPSAHNFSIESAWKIPDNLSFKSCSALFKFLKMEWKNFLKTGRDWRDFIEGIRLSANRFWKELGEKEKKILLRHLFPLWNRLRHRIPPEKASVIQKLIDSGKLKILAGRIQAIKPVSEESFEVYFKEKNKNETKKIPVSHVFNCTGPEYRLLKQKNPLLRNLLKEGLIEAGALEYGFRIKTKGLFTLGSSLFGEELETTAIPEIRAQALKISQAILSDSFIS